ncbi:carbon-nitrogen hydrolase family protein [Pedomonas sp. V897]|uniref:carbon-nitrogen hydrolase family protein n=1 Tax=Pedomonas sp. V897 TaxID=3446482 RepID=UPI003EDEBD35
MTNTTSTPATSLTLGLLQMTSSIHPEENLAALEAGVRDLAARGARFVLTPEMTGILDGNSARLRGNARPEHADETLALARRLAAELGVWLLLGSQAVVTDDEDADGRLANRAFLIDAAGQVTARYDKIHLFDVDLPSGERYRESASYRPGRNAVVAATPWGRLGLAICYDVRFPHLFRTLAKAGAQMIAVPAAFTRTTGEAHWHTLLRARAIETGCFILAPAQTGLHKDGRTTFGHSLVVAPWGEILADGGEEAGGILAEIDLAHVEAARSRIPALEHDRAFDLVEVGNT